MKYLRSMMVMLLTLTLFSACKKDEVKKETPQGVSKTMKGIWNGTYYNIDQTSTTFDLKLELGDNGKLKKIPSINEMEGEGNWSIDGTQFNATYQDLPLKMTVYSITGFYDAVSGKITGMYINSASPGTTLHFIITKQ